MLAIAGGIVLAFFAILLILRYWRWFALAAIVSVGLALAALALLWGGWAAWTFLSPRAFQLTAGVVGFMVLAAVLGVVDGLRKTR
jgi:hypothetical protein